MKALIDSTVIIHINHHFEKMDKIINDLNITEYYISRISYLEILAGSTIKNKNATRKYLQPYKILEFSKEAVTIANTLSMKYMVRKNNSKDFIIASIAIANKLPLLTENNKDFTYTGLKILPYRINDFW